jgi:predicted nucleic acid-binding protein
MRIAATAAHARAALATRNPRDLEGCGLEVIDPFSTASWIKT